MRRMAPPARMNVDRRAVSPFCQVFRGSSGLSLVDGEPPQARVDDASPIGLMVGAPFPTEAMVATASGRIVLGWGQGVARTILIPELAQAFDRRPPGLIGAAGAVAANAALLHADDGWRAVVLPSMGDRLTDLGPGPAAISPDGLRVAAVQDGAVVESALADGTELGRHEGPAAALTYTPAGVLRIADRGVTALAAGGETVLAWYDDGSFGPFGGDGRWTVDVGTPRTLAVSDDGAWAVIGGDDAVTLVRSTDGVAAARIAGASAIAMVAGGHLAIGGNWGIALVGSTEETA